MTLAVLIVPPSQSGLSVQVHGRLMLEDVVQEVDQNLRRCQTQHHLEVVTPVSLST